MSLAAASFLRSYPAVEWETRTGHPDNVLSAVRRLQTPAPHARAVSSLDLAAASARAGFRTSGRPLRSRKVVWRLLHSDRTQVRQRARAAPGSIEALVQECSIDSQSIGTLAGPHGLKV